MADHLPYGSPVHPDKPAATLSEWALVINGLVSQSLQATAVQNWAPTAAEKTSEYGAPATRFRTGAAPVLAQSRLLTQGPAGVGAAPIDTSAASFSNGAASGFHMAAEVAEHLVAEGLDPDFLGDLATASGLEPRDVLEFAGIDRTTVSRRKASGAALPQDAAVKALQATDLMTQATEVFGSPALASAWLSKAHPLLEGLTPLRRARTPWGMDKVRSMLVALRFGGVA